MITNTRDWSVRTAAKEHKCVGCPEPITPGTRYYDVVTAPWAIMIDDVDDDGRPIGSRLDTWEHDRFHSECYDRMMLGGW